MPRGIETRRPMLVGRMEGALARRESSEEACEPAIATVVEAFTKAWFEGDAPGMARALHPDYAAHVLGTGPEPTLAAVTRVLGVQASLGPSVEPLRRCGEVKVLDRRGGVASILAVLGDWLAYLHLTRLGDQWAIVNVLWNWQPGMLQNPAH